MSGNCLGLLKQTNNQAKKHFDLVPVLPSLSSTMTATTCNPLGYMGKVGAALVVMMTLKMADFLVFSVILISYVTF